VRREPRIDATPELVGVLRRQMTARVLNFSVSGCLLETSVNVAVGSACELRVSFADHVLVDDIRVTRCVELPGAAPRYRVGAQFLWTTNPGPQSLRRLAATMRTPGTQGSDTVAV
jgi:hypothetical protein